jgi:hypothetical protein
MNEAYAVLERWGRAFNTGDADAVASLYAPGATICGMLAQSHHLACGYQDVFLRSRSLEIEGRTGTACAVADFRDLRHRCRSLRFHAHRGRTDISSKVQFFPREAEWHMDDRASAFILPAQARRRLGQQKGRPCGRPSVAQWSFALTRFLYANEPVPTSLGNAMASDQWAPCAMVSAPWPQT